MALFPGATGADILEWRGITELAGDIRKLKADRLKTLGSREGLRFLNDLRGRLDDEIAFEEEFAAGLSGVQEALVAGRTTAEFASVHERFVRLAEEYYRKRGSVIALHTICNTFRDALFRKALVLAEEQLEREGSGRSPATFCLLAGGSAGRMEQTFCVATYMYLIHDDLPDEGSDWFQLFMHHAANLMIEIGLAPGNGATAIVDAMRAVDRSGWLGEIAGILGRGDRQQRLELLERADLRLVAGDGALAEEMLLTVRSALGYGGNPVSEPTAAGVRDGASLPLSPLVLRGVGRTVAEMQTGLDFFSRLRLEKRGPHKGKFDLERYALLPLIANVRMLAVYRGLRETATIERIKGLLSCGCLNVDLTEILLRAYHDFSRMKIDRQLAVGCGRADLCFIDPRDLSPEEGSCFRNGLEAVTSIEKIVYLCFTEKG
jgi:CBS domain-containing protein